MRHEPRRRFHRAALPDVRLRGRVYDRARPRYPEAVFAHIADRLPGRRVLEIGAGTGLATVGLAALDVDVTCVEPDPDMAAVLAARADAGLSMRVAVQKFESFPIEEPFDGFVSAQAWHWTDPATRMDRAARALVPGGHLCLMWNRGVFTDDELAEALYDVHDGFGIAEGERPNRATETAARSAGDDGGAGNDAAVPEEDQWPGDEIAEHVGFDFLGLARFPWDKTYSADELAAHLTSTSHYRVMESDLRDRVLTAVKNVIDDRFDGRAAMTWATHCYEAVRRL